MVDRQTIDCFSSGNMSEKDNTVTENKTTKTM